MNTFVIDPLENITCYLTFEAKW